MRPRRIPLAAAAIVLATAMLTACGKHGTSPALTGDPVTTTTSTTIAPLATTTTAPQTATSTSTVSASSTTTPVSPK